MTIIDDRKHVPLLT